MRGWTPDGGEIGDGGFAALDALVALTIVAGLSVLAANAASIGLRSSRAATERDQAIAELDYRLVTAWPRLRGPGQLTGEPDAAGGAWRLEATLAQPAEAGQAGLCRVTLAVTPRGARRAYRAETLKFCGSAA